MLAVSAQPFDAPEYLFEIKWDGVRALTSRTAQGWQLWGRDGADYRSRYPELAALEALPQGTLLDGEIVLLRQGVPDLQALLARHALQAPGTHATLARCDPVQYVVFDALYDRGQCLLGMPLSQRRQVAAERVAALPQAPVRFCDAVVGSGVAYFEQVVAAGHEGVMAKHRDSPYRPGRRCVFWKKIKPSAGLPAVIIGYLPGRDGVRGVLVAAMHQGHLRYVALVKSGLRATLRRQLSAQLAGRACARPAVYCPHRAVWVRPELYCQVRYLHWTAHGRLFGASFHGLLDSPEAVPASSSR
jgi:ATP-dependent DNA ligase